MLPPSNDLADAPDLLGVLDQLDTNGLFELVRALPDHRAALELLDELDKLEPLTVLVVAGYYHADPTDPVQDVVAGDLPDVSEDGQTTVLTFASTGDSPMDSAVRVGAHAAIVLALRLLEASPYEMDDDDDHALRCGIVNAVAAYAVGELIDPVLRSQLAHPWQRATQPKAWVRSPTGVA